VDIFNSRGGYLETAHNNYVKMKVDVVASELNIELFEWLSGMNGRRKCRKSSSGEHNSIGLVKS
jgi:hypothetical protein